VICPGGASSTSADLGNGPYTVGTDGTLDLDFDPSNPGEETTTFFLSADGAVAIGTRTDTSADSFLSIAIKLSAGKNNCSLSGNYHFVRLFERNDMTNFSTRVDQGIMPLLDEM